MKKLLAPIAALALILTIGCKTSGNNPNIGPALLRFTVSTAAGYELSQRTNAVAGVKLGRDVICAAAHGTNLSPAKIVADINALQSLSPDEVFIIRAAVGAYTLIYNGYADAPTNSAEIQPYLEATCAGLSDALPPGGLARSRAAAVIAPTQWVSPQVKFRKSRATNSATPR